MMEARPEGGACGFDAAPSREAWAAPGTGRCNVPIGSSAPLRTGADEPVRSSTTRIGHDATGASSPAAWRDADGSPDAAEGSECVGPRHAVDLHGAVGPAAAVDGCHALRPETSDREAETPRASTAGRPGSEVAAHLPLVRAIAARLYRGRWSDALPFEEYVQMGALGLLEAAQRYDGARGVSFGAFASWRIAGSILNGLERATEQHQQLAARRRRLVGERLASLGDERRASAGDERGSRAGPAASAGREGTNADVDPSSANERCGASGADALERRLARLAAVAAGLMVGFMLEGTGMYSDGAEATTRDGCAALAARELGHRLRGALAQLPGAERRVLEAHYFEQRAFADIAQALDLSRGRVSQIHRRGVERLREALGADAPAPDFEVWL